jgi:hypothetical protein
MTRRIGLLAAMAVLALVPARAEAQRGRNSGIITPFGQFSQADMMANGGDPYAAEAMREQQMMYMQQMQMMKMQQQYMQQMARQQKAQQDYLKKNPGAAPAAASAAAAPAPVRRRKRSTTTSTAKAKADPGAATPKADPDAATPKAASNKGSLSSLRAPGTPAGSK